MCSTCICTSFPRSGGDGLAMGWQFFTRFLNPFAAVGRAQRLQAQASAGVRRWRRFPLPVKTGGLQAALALACRPACRLHRYCLPPCPQIRFALCCSCRAVSRCGGADLADPGQGPGSGRLLVNAADFVNSSRIAAMKLLFARRWRPVAMLGASLLLGLAGCNGGGGDVCCAGRRGGGYLRRAAAAVWYDYWVNGTQLRSLPRKISAPCRPAWGPMPMPPYFWLYTPVSGSGATSGLDNRNSGAAVYRQQPLYRLASAGVTRQAPIQVSSEAAANSDMRLARSTAEYPEPGAGNV